MITDEDRMLIAVRMGLKTNRKIALQTGLTQKQVENKMRPMARRGLVVRDGNNWVPAKK